MPADPGEPEGAGGLHRCGVVATVGRQGALVQLAVLGIGDRPAAGDGSAVLLGAQMVAISGDRDPGEELGNTRVS